MSFVTPLPPLSSFPPPSYGTLVLMSAPGFLSSFLLVLFLSFASSSFAHLLGVGFVSRERYET